MVDVGLLIGVRLILALADVGLLISVRLSLALDVLVDHSILIGDRDCF